MELEALGRVRDCAGGMIWYARFVGGPKDGDREPLRDPRYVIEVALPQRIRWEGDAGPTAPAIPRGVYRGDGLQVGPREILYRYQGADAWAFFVGDNEVSPALPTKPRAYEWLRGHLGGCRSCFYGTMPELRWVPPA